MAAACAPVAVADLPQPDPRIGGLQIGLRARGFYRGPIDGLNGPLTKAAVEALQRRGGRPPTGILDLRTRRLLGVLGSRPYGSRVLRQGMRGLDVAALEFELRYHGFPNDEDGTFDRPTRTALAAFQRFAGLVVDAVAGPAVYQVLAQPPPRPPQLRPPLAVPARAIAVAAGTELVCPYATAVAAAMAGRIRFAGDRGRGYGYSVIIRSPRGFELLYAHLARIDVRSGQRIVAGAMVGLAGWTGKRRAQTSLLLELTLRGARLDILRALGPAYGSSGAIARDRHADQ